MHEWHSSEQCRAAPAASTSNTSSGVSTSQRLPWVDVSIGWRCMRPMRPMRRGGVGHTFCDASQARHTSRFRKHGKQMRHPFLASCRQPPPTVARSRPLETHVVAQLSALKVAAVEPFQ